MVDDDALDAILRAGRPAGDDGAVVVDGLRCPTISKNTSPTNRPMLCVHGLGHDSWDWAPFFVRCKNSVLALDLPGFGFADKPAERRWDLAVLVDAVLAAAAALPAPPVVVASSLGGHVALLAALRQPEAFAGLALCAPGGIVQVPAPMQALLRAYYSVDAIGGRPEGEVVGNSRKIFARSGLAIDDELAARKLAVRRSRRARAFAVPFAGVVDDVFRHVVLDQLSQLRTRALICVGEQDVVVPPEACAAAARTLGCRFVSFPGVGHCPHLEVPDLFADVVLSFAEGSR
jgi:pimeloyl-ACP methyl ester carboxylesterase